MTKKSKGRIERDKAKKFEQSLGKEMMMAIIGLLVEQAGGEVRIHPNDLKKARDIGMVQEADGRLLLATWQGNFREQQMKLAAERVKALPMCPHGRREGIPCPHCLGINGLGINEPEERTDDAQ